MRREDAGDLEVRRGDKMIEVKVRLWTNGIAEGRGRIRPKHAHDSGVVRIKRNKAHGLVPRRPVAFNSFMELPSAIEKALIAHGVKIHPSRRMGRYLR